MAGSNAKNSDGILHDRGVKTTEGDGLFQNRPTDKAHRTESGTSRPEAARMGFGPEMENAPAVYGPGRFGEGPASTNEEAGEVLEIGSIGSGEIAAPVFRGRNREHGFEFHLLVHFKGNGLRGVAAAFAVGVLEFVPMDASFTGTGGGFRIHTRKRDLSLWTPMSRRCKQRMT